LTEGGNIPFSSGYPQPETPHAPADESVCCFFKSWVRVCCASHFFRARDGWRGVDQAEELEICKLAPDEMQKRMLAKVRADNAQAQAAEEKVRQVKEELRRTEAAAAELKADLDERAAGGSSEKDKYEKLYARDREMSEFIAGFEPTKAELGGETAATQGRIVALLAHIAGGLESESSMPDQAKAKALTEEASFKAKQLESSQQTYVRLAAERDQRAAEVEKIATLDVKMQLELSSLGAKLGAMRHEMVALEDLEGLRTRAAHTMHWLQEQVTPWVTPWHRTHHSPTRAQRGFPWARSRLSALGSRAAAGPDLPRARVGVAAAGGLAAAALRGRQGRAVGERNLPRARGERSTPAQVRKPSSKRGGCALDSRRAFIPSACIFTFAAFVFDSSTQVRADDFSVV
jgi:hypothetical protein